MAVSAPLDLVVLISGRGSNLLAIQSACAEGRLNARIRRVIADRPEAGGLELARAQGLEQLVVSYRDPGGRAAFERQLSASIDASLPGPTQGLIVLAGFMRILGDDFIARYRSRLLNIHPSLLPAYRGLDTHRRALADGVAWHGASVHAVSPELDGGPVIAQVRVKVAPGDTVATLSARVQRGEHRLYWRVIDWVARGRLSLGNGLPQFDGRTLSAPIVWRLPDDDAGGELLDETI